MFFSVIIPIYNVERFILRGFESLKSQSFTDFEVILVDDGSTDSSPDICDSLASGHPEVSVIHKKNKGAGPARNVGIDAARGEYLLFFDIDDLLKPSAFDRLHEVLSQEPVDVLVFGYEEVNPELKLSSGYRFPQLSCHNNNDIRDIYPEHLSGIKFNNGFVWNKAYRRDFVKDYGLRFEALRIQQDEVFNLAVYPKARTLRTIPDILYTYFVYDSGNTRSRYIPERLEIYRRVRDAFLSLYSIWELEDKKLLEFIHRHFFDSIVCLINSGLFHPDNGIEYSRRKHEIATIIQSPDIQLTLHELSSCAEISSSYRKGYFKAMQEQSTDHYIRVMHEERLKTRLKKIARKILLR